MQNIIGQALRNHERIYHDRKKELLDTRQVF
jgi:hypothetical protein